MRLAAALLAVTLTQIANSAELADGVRAYQQALITHGVTGSSIAGVFQGNNTLALSAVTSEIPDDGSISQDTIFPIWSMSKPITIVAMMILRDKGTYRVDEPVSKYIPDFRNLMCKPTDNRDDIYPCENELLIEHLLTHRSGYSYYGAGFGEGPDFRFPYNDLEEFVQHVSAQPLEFEPGTEYLYGINQAILGRLVELLSGREFYTFLNTEIFKPLGMTQTKFSLSKKDRQNFQPLYRKGQYKLGVNLISPDQGESKVTRDFDELNYSVGTKKQLGGEGLVSTFRDYRRFCEMLLNRGEMNGQRILSKESFLLMTKTVTPPQISNGYNNGFGYAYSMFNLEEPSLDGTGAPKGIFGWSGYHNTHFWIDQENGIYGLFMTRTTPFSFEIQKHFRAAVYKAL